MNRGTDGSERKTEWKRWLCAPRSALRVPSFLLRLHRDERGYTMLDYVMVFAFIAVPLMFLFDKLFEVLSDYFGMVAYYVTWPFL